MSRVPPCTAQLVTFPVTNPLTCADTGNYLVFLTVYSYLSAGYTLYAASALASMNVVRNAVAAVFPLFTTRKSANTSFPRFPPADRCLLAGGVRRDVRQPGRCQRGDPDGRARDGPERDPVRAVCVWGEVAGEEPVCEGVGTGGGFLVAGLASGGIEPRRSVGLVCGCFAIHRRGKERDVWCGVGGCEFWLMPMAIDGTYACGARERHTPKRDTPEETQKG